MSLPTGINEQDRLLTLNIKDETPIDFGHLSPGMKVWPLFIDPDAGTSVYYAQYAPGTRLPAHFHTGPVHFFTTRGRWSYIEYPQDEQREGSYLFEPTGSVHSLCVPEDGEVTEGFMVINGANISFDEDGEYLGTDHAGSIEKSIIDAAKLQGIDLPRYIRPSGAVAYTRG